MPKFIALVDLFLGGPSIRWRSEHYYSLKPISIQTLCLRFLFRFQVDNLEHEKFIGSLIELAMTTAFTEHSGKYQLHLKNYKKNYAQFWGTVDTIGSSFSDYTELVSGLRSSAPGLMELVATILAKFNVDFLVVHRQLEEIDIFRSYEYAFYERMYADRDKIIDTISSQLMNVTDSLSYMCSLISEQVSVFPLYSEYRPLNSLRLYYTDTIIDEREHNNGDINLYTAETISLSDESDDASVKYKYLPVIEHYVEKNIGDGVFFGNDAAQIALVRFVKRFWPEIIEKRLEYEEKMDCVAMYRFSNAIVMYNEFENARVDFEGSDKHSSDYYRPIKDALHSNAQVASIQFDEDSKESLERLIAEYRKNTLGHMFYLTGDARSIINQSPVEFYLQRSDDFFSEDENANKPLDDQAAYQFCGEFLERLFALFEVDCKVETNTHGVLLIKPNLSWQRYFPRDRFDWSVQNDSLRRDFHFSDTVEFLETFRLEASHEANVSEF